MSLKIKTVSVIFFILIGFSVATAAPAVKFVKKGDDDGLVDVSWFIEAIKDLPSNVTVYDVRTPEEYAGGHVKGAINLPLAMVYKKGGCEKVVSKLKKGEFAIFMCLGGSKSGGMYYKLLDECKYAEPEKLFYLGATTTFVDGKPVIEE